MSNLTNTTYYGENSFCINKSGKTVPVYSDINKTRKVGEIYNREAYGYNRVWGGDGYYCSILFLGPSGSLTGGYVIDPPDGFLMPCSEYPAGTILYNGETYLYFTMRKTKNVYDRDGNFWGSVAAGRKVLTKNSSSGTSNPHYKEIEYVQHTSGNYVPFMYNEKDENNNTISVRGHGFVDTGLASGSSSSAIAMYGSW